MFNPYSYPNKHNTIQCEINTLGDPHCILDLYDSLLSDISILQVCLIEQYLLLSDSYFPHFE